MTYYAEIFFEVELENAERIASIFDWGCDGNERKYDVAFSNVVLDPFAMY